MKLGFLAILSTLVFTTTASAATIPVAKLVSSSAFAGPNIDGACGVSGSSRDPSRAAVAGGIDLPGGTGNNCTSAARARVGAGYVSAYSEVAMDSVYGSARHGMTASATATWTLDFGIANNYVFNGPERIGVNFDAAAAVAASFDDAFGNLFTTGAGALVSGSVTLTGSNNNIDVRRSTRDFRFDTSVSRDDAGPDDDSDSLSGNQPLSVAVMADPRRPITIMMTIGASSNVVGPRSAEVRSVANGSQTLNFAQDRGVFEVSDGVIADFAELSIFNNRWVEPRIPQEPPVTPIPLPAGMPLMFAALGLLAVSRRHVGA
ncbi:MAG: hypothetical protein AAF965_01305 [Pseudomonadota bacterium]